MRHLIYFGEGLGILVGGVSILIVLAILMNILEDTWRDLHEDIKAVVVISIIGGIVLAFAYGIGYAVSNQ